MKKLVFLIIFLIGISIIANSNIKAASPGCDDNNIPLNCPNDGEYEPNYACIIARTFSTPDREGNRVDCCINKCKNSQGTSSEALPQEFREFTFFNVKVKISYEKIPTLINLGFSTFIGILAIYAAIRGVYIYAIKMGNATKDEDIAAVSKEARAILIGFILAVTFLFLTQLVFSILGLPALNELDLSVDPSSSAQTDGTTIVIQ